MTEINVKVETQASSFEIEPGLIYSVKLTEKAENNRANAELVSKMSEILGKDVGLVKGHRSRRKKLKVDLKEEEVEEKVKEWARRR